MSTLDNRQLGFSLVEVMVALVVCSVGLLGLAKMESLALSSTGVAGNRSIAAIQASSLASAMHANRGFWAAGLAPPVTTVTITNGAVVISDPNLGVAPEPSCIAPNVAATACTMDQMAAYDFQEWSKALAALMKNSLATISCTNSTAAVPVSCNIQIQWVESIVAGDVQQSQANLTAMINNNSPTYVLYVQP
jgi:type IV pilus assembly protein PilV